MRNRAPSHTAADWQRIRPTFIDLYITQNKPLEQVRKILQTQYGFNASPKQCKNKIDDWKIGKHLSERDALHILRKIRQTDNRPGRRRVIVKLRGRETGIDKVMKHFQRKDITNVQDLLERLPRSPTPSSISCEEVDEVEGIPQSSPPLTTQTSGLSQEGTSVMFTPSSGQVGSSISFPLSLDDPLANMYPALSRETTSEDAFAHTEALHSNAEDLQFISGDVPVVPAEYNFNAFDTNIFDSNSTDLYFDTGDNGWNSGQAQIDAFHNQFIPRTPSPMQTTLLEQGMKGIEALVQFNVRFDQKDCKNWWDTSRTIAGDLINAQGFLNTGQMRYARFYCDKLVETATNTVKVQDMTVLQLIAHLFSWAAYPQYAPLVRILLMYLARLKSTDQQPILAVVARSLVTNVVAPREAMAKYMECITQQLDYVLGPDSVMAMWMKVRLCRHLHAAGQKNSAKRLLYRVHRIWLGCRDTTPKSLLLKMDRELGVTFYQFGDFEQSLHHLNQALDGFDVNIGGISRQVYLLQRLAACYLELGYIDIALKHARRGLAGLERLRIQNYPWSEQLKAFVHELEQQLQATNVTDGFHSPCLRYIDNEGNDISVFEKYFPGDSYDATFVEKTPCFDDGVIAQYGETLFEEQDETSALWSSFEKLSVASNHAQVSRTIVDMQECTAGADLCLSDQLLTQKPFHDWKPIHDRLYPDIEASDYKKLDTPDIEAAAVAQYSYNDEMSNLVGSQTLIFAM